MEGEIKLKIALSIVAIGTFLTFIYSLCKTAGEEDRWMEKEFRRLMGEDLDDDY